MATTPICNPHSPYLQGTAGYRWVLWGIVGYCQGFQRKEKMRHYALKQMQNFREKVVKIHQKDYIFRIQDSFSKRDLSTSPIPQNIN